MTSKNETPQIVCIHKSTDIRSSGVLHFNVPKDQTLEKFLQMREGLGRFNCAGEWATCPGSIWSTTFGKCPQSSL